MNIEALNNEWFYDDVSARGVSFDAFLPQACKTPLGNMHEFELIHTPEKMAHFQNNDWYNKNWSLADTLMTFSPLLSGTHKLVDAYRKEICKILSRPCDSCPHDVSCGACLTKGSCRGLRVLHKDLSRYADVMAGSKAFDEGKFYDVKKEIYRLTDRVFAALAKCYEVNASGTFAILDELKSKELITTEAKDNLAGAAAIAIQLRINTYIKAGKQGEHLSTIPNEETGKLTSVYHMPKDEDLFPFFFIAIPLYEELQQITSTGNIPSSLVHRSFFDDSDVTMGHVHCRLLEYHKALKCYERAVQKCPENLGTEIRRIRVALLITKNTEESDKIQESLEILLGKIGESFSQSRCNDNQIAPECATFISRLAIEECRQFVEVLLCASKFYDCDQYFALAEKILTQCLTAGEGKRREFLMMKYAFFEHLVLDGLAQDEIDAEISELRFFIDEEGVSTQSLVCLKRLGKFLLDHGKLDKAYRCFQRALCMEYLLYGTKPNVNIATSLKYLGRICAQLSLYAESKFYLGSLVEMFESFATVASISLIKETFLLLSLVSVAVQNPPEETISYLEKSLNVSIDSSAELYLDFFSNCNLATAWHTKQNSEQAWKAVLEAQACLKKAPRSQKRLAMACMIAKDLSKINKTIKGIALLKEELEPSLEFEPQEKQKAVCLQVLGDLCVKQGLTSDAKNYYKQALQSLVDMENDERVFILSSQVKCYIGISNAIGISKAIEIQGDLSEAKLVLDKAFNSAKKIPWIKEKCSFLKKIGNLCEGFGEIKTAALCYVEALRTCMEETNTSKNLSFMKIDFEMKLGDLLSDTSTTTKDPLIPEFKVTHDERIHYDHAAEILREHVATGQVDTRTVTRFLLLALRYRLISDSDRTKTLSLEALKVNEIVYGPNESNELTATIMGQLSDAHFMTGDVPASIKTRERLMKIEMELHLSNPFHEHTSENLMMWAFFSLQLPGSIDAIECAYEFLLTGGKYKDLTNNDAKEIAARCFTFLGILFYTSGNLVKAKTVNEMASQLFIRIHENIRTECHEMCDLMTNILLSKMTLSSTKTKIIESFGKIMAVDDSKDTLLVNKASSALAQPIETNDSSLNLMKGYALSQNDEQLQQNQLSDNRARDHKPDKEPARSTFPNDLKTSGKCSDGRKHLKSFIPISDGEDVDGTDSSDAAPIENWIQTLPQLSSSNELQGPESLQSTPEYFGKETAELYSMLPFIHLELNALEYNISKRKFQPAAEIHASLQRQLLSFYKNNSFDVGEKLISNAITAKKGDRPLKAIRFLDLALELPSDWRRKAKVLKLRGECFLSAGSFRSSAINLTEAVAVYSGQSIDNYDDLREYCEVSISLIKSEMLCKNVAEAWLICQKAIKMVTKHEFKEAINMQAIEVLYLGGKCLNILTENEENKDDKLAHACSLCQQALTLSQRTDETRNGSDLKEELGSLPSGEFFATKYEVQLLLATIYLKLQKGKEADKILRQMKAFFMNIAAQFDQSMLQDKPDFIKISGRAFAWLGRVLVTLNEIDLFIVWPNKSLVAFFSGALPNILSFYEEFLPLLNAITVTKSNGLHKYRSPFQQAVDMCKETLAKQSHSLDSVYEFLKTLVNLYRSLGKTEEAMLVAEIALRITDLMCDDNVGNRISNRARMQLYLAEIHQLNALNSAFDTNEELILTERFYRADRGYTDDCVLQKNLSYANFLCENERFRDAEAVLRDMNNLGKAVWDKYVYFDYSSRAFYGKGVQKSIENDGELLTTVGDVMCCLQIRVFVGMGQKKEAVAAYENMTAVISPEINQAIFGTRPSSKAYLIEDCQRELLSLLSPENQSQFQSFDLPLSPTNRIKLYYMLNEYVLALQCFPQELESPELLEMKISCLCLAGNKLVNLNRVDESFSYFRQFVEILEAKESFLELPFHNQCKVLEKYSSANKYYVFRCLAQMHCERGNIDATIQCYERCLELDEDFACDQNIVGTLSDLYQSKASMVGENERLKNELMELALNLYQKLLQKTDDMTIFAELTFASLLSKSGRYLEAAEHFDNVIQRADNTSVIIATNSDKPLADVYLRCEIEAHGGRLIIPLKVYALYELILTHLKFNEIEKAQEVALLLENALEFYQSSSLYAVARSMVGYAYMLTGKKEKAAEIFVSVLLLLPGHKPVTEALENCFK